MLRRFIEMLGRRGAGMLAAGLATGLLVPPLSELMRPLLTPAVFALLAVAITRVNLGELRMLLRRPVLLGLSLLWMLLAIPIIAGLVVTWIGEARLGTGLTLAIILISCAPPLVSAPALCDLLKLNGSLSLTLLLISTALTPLVTPLMTGFWVSGDMPLSPLDLGQRLFVLVGGASALAFAVRRWLGPPGVERNQPVFDGLNVLFLIIFAIALMDGIANRLIEEPVRFAGLAALSFSLALGMMAATTVLFWRTEPQRALSIGYTTGFRNIALAVGALGAAAPDDTWLMFAVGQFPIYLGPLILKPVCRRLLA